MAPSVKVLCIALLMVMRPVALRAQPDGQPPQPAVAAPCTLQTGGLHVVAGVVDAENIVLEDGTQVRLAGILAPAPPAYVAPRADWPPLTAARAALDELLRGRTVELAYEQRRADRWNRVLAHVFVTGPAEREWVQGYLLRHGHARVDALPDARACLSELLAHERTAREARAGLWRNPAYRQRPAEAPQRLMRLRNTFQIIEGRVRKIAVLRNRIYVNFGDDWRTDFTAGPRRSSPFAAESIAALQRLEGRRVRVRGWIERRNGPYVELFHPLQIEDIDGETLPPSSGSPRGAPAPVDEAPPSARSPPAAPPNEKRPEHEAPGAIDL